MKIIAFYLPQYHRVKENDEWWGEGFTEWTNLRKARPLFEGHYQPRVPLNNNYYDLSMDDPKEWQCRIAREHGIYGFCIYHYWFNGHLLLEKPVEQYLQNPKCDLPFCICWANENWTNVWSAGDKATVLLSHKKETPKEWEEHFFYLLPFFKDKRYIKDDNGKLLFVIFRPDLITECNEMLRYWDNLAVKEGLPGFSFAYQSPEFDDQTGKDDSEFKYAIEYQPIYALKEMTGRNLKGIRNVKKKLDRYMEKKGMAAIDLHQMFKGKNNLYTFDYDEVWETVLNRIPQSDKYITGCFVDWDSSPRRGLGGRIFLGASPEKFGKYLAELIKKEKREYHKDMIFAFAWNEWTEGGYLEPDERFGYGYLEAIKRVLEETGEFPDYEI